MQKQNRRALSPTRDELAELVTIVDPHPPELPEDVVDLLRRARRYCKSLIDHLPREEQFECMARQVGDFEESIDELLQKYNYSMPARRLGYGHWEGWREVYG